MSRAENCACISPALPLLAASGSSGDDRSSFLAPPREQSRSRKAARTCRSGHRRLPFHPLQAQRLDQIPTAILHLDVELNSGRVGHSIDAVEAGDHRRSLGGAVSADRGEKAPARGGEAAAATDHSPGETDQGRSVRHPAVSFLGIVDDDRQLELVLLAARTELGDMGGSSVEAIVGR